MGSMLLTAIALTNLVAQSVLPFDRSATKSVMFACERACELDAAADSSWRRVSSRAEYDALRNDLRMKMLAACGTFPERTPLNARTLSVVRHDGYSIEKVVFESMPGIVVTANLFLPENPRPCPVVVISCGHTAEGKDCDEFLRTCVVAVRRGLAAFAFDPYEQGERRWHYVHNACFAHNQIGLRAALLDWSMPMLRIWDGMRAIDYVQSRKEIDPTRIGYMGQSGGGTMTALMQVADRRIKVAAPSCYLTTFSSLCRENGPQDAEQNIFGQLQFGLNHVGYVLIPDIPVAITCRHSDFFRFYGTQTLYGLVTEVSDRLKLGDRYLLNDALGPHGWSEATRTSSVEFIANHLFAKTDKVVDVDGNRLLDYGFEMDKSDRGLSADERGCFSLPLGSGLPGAKSILSVIADKAQVVEKSRHRMGREERTGRIRQLAKIPDVRDVRFKEYEQIDAGDGVIVTKIVAQFGSGRPMPVMKIAKKGADDRQSALIVAAYRGRMEGLALAAKQIEAGTTVYLVDVAGIGEVGEQQQAFYGCEDRQDEGLGGTLFLLGETLVGWRAGDLIALARYVGGAPDLLVNGPLAIAAAHARAAYPELWGRLILKDVPPSWKRILEYEGKDIEFHYADLVPKAYLCYDWKDLIEGDYEEAGSL